MNKEYIKEFGIGMYAIAGFTRVLRKLKLDGAVKSYERFKYAAIIRWLDKRYGKEADKAAVGYTNHCKIKKDSPVWIFWWQGEESMPPVVKSCYKSVLRNAEDHPVILITESNAQKYVDIPQYIYQKLEENKMTLTHFSDILRENLLYNHGGIWMDSTIYMTAPFSEEMYEYEYYSIKGAFDEWEWTGFFQATGKGNIFAKVVSHLFNCYWKEHDCLISYLLIDCFFYMTRKHSLEINLMINNLPKKDSSIFRLNDFYLDKQYNNCIFEEIKRISNIHKLSYKYPHYEEIDGNKTIWGYLIEEGRESK